MSGGKLVLLRHGAMASKGIVGWTDVDLSPEGQAEATAAGRLLKEKGFKCDIVFTSLLRRSVKSAWMALMELENFAMPVINSWRLNERHFGDLQGKEGVSVPPTAPTALTITDSRHPANDSHYRNVHKGSLPGSESMDNVVERMLPFWSDNIAPCVMAGKTVLVSGHASLRAISKLLEDLPDDKVPELAPGVPFVYELDANLKVTKKYYLQDDSVVKAKLSTATE
mmetsp:Transcript_136397/g.192922  ORF Transcript_136397/g.192922 Transcript_136397/m.192922 type:complete len:225 (-) Transcript_136397:24-698(-)